jgi:hypothetical protein
MIVYCSQCFRTTRLLGCHTYVRRINFVSTCTYVRMYLDWKAYSQDYLVCILTISCLYPVCILSVSCLYLVCILTISCLYLVCILSVSCLYLVCILTIRMYRLYLECTDCILTICTDCILATCRVHATKHTVKTVYWL